MYNAHLTFARPPRIHRTPRCIPLSWFKGATPTKEEIQPLEALPNSGKLEINVANTTNPTPGTLCNNSSRGCQVGVRNILPS